MIPIVASTNLESRQLWNDAFINNYGTPAITLLHGKGSEVWDVEGKRYLDMLAGIATNILGHAQSDILDSIKNQSEQLWHVSNLYSHPAGIKLATKLISLTGESSSRVFFCNSGAEANEAALKLSRLTSKKTIVSTLGSFHGRTIGALSMTGQKGKRAPFFPLLKSVKFIPFNDLKAAKKAINKRVAMVIVEPIQGENGVRVPDSGYLKALREMTKKHGVLLAFDCVQTGMGRTGTWFGFENEEVLPDVITLAKGLGAGLPLGAMIAIGECASLFQPGMHGSTFGGNPVACAAGLAAIEVIERDELLKVVKDLELLIKIELSKNMIVEEVRGSGLLIGIELQRAIAKDFVARLADHGVLANATDEETIRIAPSLNITKELVEEFIATFREVANSYER